MLHRYLKDDGPVPPAAFISAASSVLRPVRAEWLASGEGEPTDGRTLLAADVADPEPNIWEELALAAFPELKSLPKDLQIVVFGLADRFTDAIPGEWHHALEGQEFQVRLGTYLAILRHHLLGPLYAWTDAPDFADRRVQNYLLSALAAFALSVPERLPRAPQLVQIEVSVRPPAGPKSTKKPKAAPKSKKER